MEIPYGGKPYIFISYSHKNTAYVRSVISQMGKLGYRVWCDDDLPYIDDYNEVIANAIVNCDIFVVFLSQDSVRSEYVLDELYLARNKNKKMIAVFIDDCQLSAGVEMRLGRLNHIYANNCTNEQLIEKICGECISCRDVFECAPQFSEKAKEKTAPKTVAAVQKKTETAAPVKTPTETSGKPKLLKIIIPVLAAAIVIAVGLWAAFGGIGVQNTGDIPKDQEQNENATEEQEQSNGFTSNPDYDASKPYVFSYEYNGYRIRCTAENGQITITNCTRDYKGFLEIPAEIDGVPVTVIDYSAFNGCEGITSVTIPDSVTYIGDYAFNYCYNLTIIYCSRGSYAWDYCVENGIPHKAI